MPCNILPVLPQQVGHKFDPAIKGQSHPRIIRTILVDLESAMLYTKISLKAFLVQKQFFTVFNYFFYNIWAWQPSCSMGQNHLNKLLISLRQKAAFGLVKSGQGVSEKKTFKDYTTHVYSPRVRADNPKGTKFWSFTTLIIHVHVSFSH